MSERARKGDVGVRIFGTWDERERWEIVSSSSKRPTSNGQVSRATLLRFRKAERALEEAWRELNKAGQALCLELREGD